MRDALSASTQYVQVDVELDTCPEAILESDRPILEHALEGFEISAKATYNKHLAKAFQEHPAFPDDFADQFGFLFKFGVDSSLDLKFDDADDLREHPMLEDKCDLKFNDIFQMIGQDRSTFEDYELDLSQFDEAKCLADPQLKEMYMVLKGMNGVQALIKAVDRDGRFKVNFECVHEDIFHASMQAKSAGVGLLGNILFNGGVMSQRQSMYEMLC